MSKAKICDRCGNTEREDKKAPEYGGESYKTKNYSVPGMDGFHLPEYVDLCSGCQKDFRKWFDDVETT